MYKHIYKYKICISKRKLVKNIYDFQFINFEDAHLFSKSSKLDSHVPYLNLFICPCKFYFGIKFLLMLNEINVHNGCTHLIAKQSQFVF